MLLLLNNSQCLKLQVLDRIHSEIGLVGDWCKEEEYAASIKKTLTDTGVFSAWENHLHSPHWTGGAYQKVLQNLFYHKETWYLGIAFPHSTVQDSDTVHLGYL